MWHKAGRSRVVLELTLNRAINFSQQRGGQQKKGKAVLGITGSIDSGKKSP